MKKYIATTASGAEYMIDLDSQFWSHRSSGIERIWSFKNLDLDTIPWHDNRGDFWDWIGRQPQAKKPEVGKRIFVASRDRWKISTEVLSVKEIEYDDSNVD